MSTNEWFHLHVILLICILALMNVYRPFLYRLCFGLWRIFWLTQTFICHWRRMWRTFLWKQMVCQSLTSFQCHDENLRYRFRIIFFLLIHMALRTVNWSLNYLFQAVCSSFGDVLNAKCLSARLLIFQWRLFSAGTVWLVHKHPSRLGMQFRMSGFCRLCSLMYVSLLL